SLLLSNFVFFFIDTATTEIYTLSYTTLFRSSIAISLTSCLKSRVVVCLSRRIVSLCRIRGWSSTVRLGNSRWGMAGKVCRTARRSEEHTSELQSRGHLVCRLLLEKKKESRTA